VVRAARRHEPGALLHDQRRRDEARGLLQPVYDWFIEGFDTADLKDAKARLEELA
jgi:predicted ATPase